MRKDNKCSFVTGQVKAENRPGHLLRETNTIREADKAMKVTIATATFKIKLAVPGADHYVQLSEMKTMIKLALTESKVTPDSKVAGIAEETVTNAVRMCAVDVQDKPIQLTASLAIRFGYQKYNGRGDLCSPHADGSDEGMCAPLSGQSRFRQPVEV